MAKKLTTKDNFQLPVRTYPSKLLLTGEYSVLKGGSAILLPIQLFRASWQKSEQAHEELKTIFFAFSKHLKHSKHEGDILDFESMEKAFKEGYFLESNVPQGCGLGSSGVFCAALYDAFRSREQPEPSQVRKDLQFMESFFHGKSSGLDPLVSYYNQPILLKTGQLKLCQPLKLNAADLPEVWLLNSNISRSTAQLVQAFEDQLTVKKNKDDFFNYYMPLVEKATDYYLSGQLNKWYETIKSISAFQIRIFKPMIPDEILKLWIKGLVDNTYYMKLCGAGGGGFFFLFSNNKLNNSFGFEGMKITEQLSGLVAD